MLGSTELIDYLSGYSAAYDSETEDFLIHKALMMEKRALSRTYLAISSEWEILGYVTVGMKCLRVPEDNLLSKSYLRDLNIDSTTGVAQSYLLGQLSRSKNTPPGFGKDLLDYAMQQIYIAMNSVGCRIVRLDCRDELIPYYEKHGFKLVTDSSEGGLNKMLATLDNGKLGPEAR